jgi:hypothetical protein
MICLLYTNNKYIFKIPDPHSSKCVVQIYALSPILVWKQLCKASHFENGRELMLVHSTVSEGLEADCTAVKVQGNPKPRMPLTPDLMADWDV